MREFLEYVVGQLIDHPEEMVLQDETVGDTRRFLLCLSPSDVGKVIGKQGHTIRAIRNLLDAAASRHQAHCEFEILEQEPSGD